MHCPESIQMWVPHSHFQISTLVVSPEHKRASVDYGIPEWPQNVPTWHKIMYYAPESCYGPFGLFLVMQGQFGPHSDIFSETFDQQLSDLILLCHELGQDSENAQKIISYNGRIQQKMGRKFLRRDVITSLRCEKVWCVINLLCSLLIQNMF